MSRGYTLIEPDMPYSFPGIELTIRCLEVVRLALPTIIQEGTSKVEYDLLFIQGRYTAEDSEPSYPVIGMHCADEEAQASVATLDVFVLYDRVNIWVKGIGLTEVLQRASFIDYVDLKLMRSQKVYPIR